MNATAFKADSEANAVALVAAALPGFETLLEEAIAVRADLEQKVEGAQAVATRLQAELEEARTQAADFEAQLKEATDRAADLELRATRAELNLSTLQQEMSKRRR